MKRECTNCITEASVVHELYNFGQITFLCLTRHHDASLLRCQQKWIPCGCHQASQLCCRTKPERTTFEFINNFTSLSASLMITIIFPACHRFGYECLHRSRVEFVTNRLHASGRTHRAPLKHIDSRFKVCLREKCLTTKLVSHSQQRLIEFKRRESRIVCSFLDLSRKPLWSPLARTRLPQSLAKNKKFAEEN